MRKLDSKTIYPDVWSRYLCRRRCAPQIARLGFRQSYAGDGIGGAPDVRDRPREFSERRMIPKIELLRQLDEVVSAAIGALSKMTAGQMLRLRRIQGFEVNGLGAIFDSVPHFKGHTQEIVCLTRLQLEESYKFDWVPKTAGEGAGPTE